MRTRRGRPGHLTLRLWNEHTFAQCSVGPKEIVHAFTGPWGEEPAPALRTLTSNPKTLGYLSYLLPVSEMFTGEKLGRMSQGAPYSKTADVLILPLPCFAFSHHSVSLLVSAT